MASSKIILILMGGLMALPLSARASIRILKNGLSLTGIEETTFRTTIQRESSGGLDCEEFESNLKLIPIQNCEYDKGECAEIRKLIDHARYKSTLLGSNPDQTWKPNQWLSVSPESQSNVMSHLLKENFADFEISPAKQIALPLKEPGTNWKFVYNEKSFSAQILKVPGMTIIPPLFPLKNGLLIQTLGHEVACDLIQGNAYYEASASGRIVMDTTKTASYREELWELYQNLRKSSSLKPLSKMENIFIWGVRTGRILEEKHPNLNEVVFSNVIGRIGAALIDFTNQELRSFGTEEDFRKKVFPDPVTLDQVQFELRAK